MSASYLHFVKQYQNRIGLTNKELNRLDRKHNDVNLMKKLQQLYPRVSAASAAPATGFYGTLDITNEKTAGSQSKDIYARLYYGSTPLTNEITIAHPHTRQLEVLIADRLPNREAILTLRIRFQAGITSVDLDAYDGFEPAGLTENPLTENNYLSMLVNVGNVDDGILTMTLVTSTPG
jgi:hypothetical protein